MRCAEAFLEEDETVDAEVFLNKVTRRHTACSCIRCRPLTSVCVPPCLAPPPLGICEHTDRYGCIPAAALPRHVRTRARRQPQVRPPSPEPSPRSPPDRPLTASFPFPLPYQGSWRRRCATTSCPTRRQAAHMRCQPRPPPDSPHPNPDPPDPPDPPDGRGCPLPPPPRRTWCTTTCWSCWARCRAPLQPPHQTRLPSLTSPS